MQQALTQAQIAVSKNEVPNGCVIVKDNEIVTSGYNTTITTCDPTAHAEINCIRQAATSLKTEFLTDCEIYVTLEPCPMCAQAISNARIKKLVFGAYDPKSGGVIHNTQTYQHPSAHHKPEVVSGVLENQCASLIKDFFHKLR